jgi:hypothetical protein
MSACKNKKEPAPTAPSEQVSITPAEFTASVYMVDSWRKDMEDGSREYYITLLMHSEDYYDAPTSDDIKYQTDDGYASLTDAIEGSSISIYQTNAETKMGISTYAKIKTPKLIDVKKIHVLLEGPAEYDKDALTKEDYASKYGNTEGWRALLSCVSSKTPPIALAAQLQSTIDYGVVRMFDQNYSFFYYEKSEGEVVVDANKKVSKFTVDIMRDITLEPIATSIANATYCVKFIDGKAQKVELDKRLKIFSSIVNGELIVGFETVDGSDFSTYDGEIPDAIAYVYDTTHYFTID